ncbi:MAG: DNA repair exonuclease [Devosia sp.]
MTSFRFIHAADLHLGSPFRGLAQKDEAVARRFAEATRNAFSTLIDRAVEEKVDFVVIAGDVYDGEWKDNAIGLFFNREMARLSREGIPVYVLKGNHDADSVVTKSVTLPESVHQFDTRKPQTFQLDDLRVALHGQGFSDRAATENLALKYPAPVPGWFNIGVLHTSLSGRPPHANYAPCTVEELQSRGYDYWALGHVHEFEIVAKHPSIVFPGNLQGRNIRESGAKGAVLVSVTDGRTQTIERLVVDDARWHLAVIDVTGIGDLAELLSRVEASLAAAAAEADGRQVALRVQLHGATEIRPWLLSNRPAVFDELQAVGHRAHADIWLEKLELRLDLPVVAAPVVNGLELDALVAAAAEDPVLLAAANELIRDVSAKLPAGLGASGFDTDVSALLAEAQAIVHERVTRGQ